MGKDVVPAVAPPAADAQGQADSLAPKKTRRRRQKMRSTPVVGGGLFGEGRDDNKEEDGRASGGFKPLPLSGQGKSSASLLLNTFKQSGHAAELICEGEVYKIRINDATLRNLRAGYSGETLDTRGITVSGGMSIQHDDNNVVNQLHGYIRSLAPLGQISEDGEEGSDAMSDQKGVQSPKEGAV